MKCPKCGLDDYVAIEALAKMTARAEEAERKIEDIKLLICLDYESVSNPIDAIKQIIKGV